MNRQICCCPQSPVSATHWRCILSKASGFILSDSFSSKKGQLFNFLSPQQQSDEERPLDSKNKQQKCTFPPCFILNYSLGRTLSFCTSKTVCWQDPPVTSVNVRLIFTLPLHENTVKDQTATEKNSIVPHLKAL